MVVLKKRDTPLTHNELVKIAAWWLERTASNMSMRCPLIITELVTANTEIPDIIGFRYGISTLIECKASRNDFLTDRKKHFRKEADRGMGDYRYYFAPANMIQPSELPMYWGLIEVDEVGQIRIIQDALQFPEANKHGEIIMLQSVIRRLKISTAVFVRTEDPEEVPGEG